MDDEVDTSDATTKLLPSSSPPHPPTPQTTVSLQVPAKSTLDRAHLSRGTALLFCTSFVLLDSGKQVVSYALSYYNHGVYPLPQTLIVLLIELLKLCLASFFMFRQGLFATMSFSLLYAVPAVVYTCSNNLYFFALHYTTPPIWMILIQSRVILTALVYRLIFHRQVTPTQWGALILLISSILVTKLADMPISSLTSLFSSSSTTSTSNVSVTTTITSLGLSTPSSLSAASPTAMSSLTIAILLSLVSASLSVLGSVFTEFLFKNDKRVFVEQQFQLYLFSSLVSSLLTVISEVRSPQLTKGLDMLSVNILCLLILVILLSSLGGIAVAGIMKMLDNIVKIYLATLANIFNGLICSVLFPDRFTLDTTFVLALSLVFLAIYLYENKTVSCGTASSNPVLVMLRSLGDKKVLKFVVVPIVGVSVGTLIAFAASYYIFGLDRAGGSNLPRPALNHHIRINH